MVDFKLNLVTGDVDVSKGLQIIRGVDLYKQKIKLVKDLLVDNIISLLCNFFNIVFL